MRSRNNAGFFAWYKNLKYENFTNALVSKQY
jgi:hypothetical protein